MLIQRTHHPKIPKALLSAPEEYLQQKIQDKYGYSNSGQTHYQNAIERALLKYYPKYCRTIRLDNNQKSHSLLHRIKQIKCLKHFEYDLAQTNKDRTIKILKRLLVNKRKSLKSLPVIGFEKEQHETQIHHLPIMEMCSFFPQIKNLNIFLPRSQISYVDLRSISRPLKREVLESYGRFWDFLKSLKHLEISVNLPNFSAVVPYLQRSKRFLASLQSFRLKIEPKCYRRLNQTTELLFQAFLQSPHLLESISHVYFHRFESNMRKEFSALWELFTSTLKSLNNLNELKLRIYRIEDLEFPLKLKKLTLFLENFHFFDSSNPKRNFQEKNMCLWNENDDTNEETPTSNFIEKFNNLTLLNSLELNMELFTYPNDILKMLITPLLQKTPNLERFEWNFSQGYEKNICSFELSIFLESLTFHKQLQSFKISQPILDELRLLDGHGLFVTFSPCKILSFPNISSVNIEARISEDFDFRTFFMAFSEDSQSKRKKKVSLGKIHVKSIRQFIRFIKIFKEAEQFSRLKIDLEIVLCVESWEEIERNFQETIIPAKNVFINLKIYVSSLDKTNFMEAGVRALQRIFRQMKFGLTWLAKEKGTVSGYEKTVCVPFIKNNYPNSVITSSIDKTVLM